MRKESIPQWKKNENLQATLMFVHYKVYSIVNIMVYTTFLEKSVLYSTQFDFQ